MHLSPIYTNKKLKEGFTLLETLVAILILVTVVSSVLTLVSRGLSASYESRDQTIAFYLAVEAVEYIRSVRDSNALEILNGGGGGWLDGLNNPGSDCFATEGCMIDIVDQSITSCNVGGCVPLDYDSLSNKYTYTAGTPTTYVRTVHVEELIPGQEARVQVTMEWKFKNRNRSLSIEEELFNWSK